MRVQSNPKILQVLPAVRNTNSSAAVPIDISEIGGDKSGTQHVGNVGFGLATAANIALTITASTPISKIVPGLNLAVAGVEGVNFLRAHHNGDKIVAATHLGNSMGCLAGFLEESGAWALTANKAGMGASLALAGGALGLAVGIGEIHYGLKVLQTTGSKRTLAMGVLDSASGLFSLGAAAMASNGITGHLGVGLLLVSGFIDLAGIGRRLRRAQNSLFGCLKTLNN